ALRPHETAAIARTAVLERDGMDETVAIERVIAADRFVDLVLAGADIDPVDVGRYIADHFGIAIGEYRVPLVVGRSPRALHIGMVVRLDRRLDRLDKLGGHARAPSVAAKRGRVAAASYSFTRRSTIFATGSTPRTAPTPCPA